ncbi:membrane associated protein [Cryptosporidium ryanae]|uniref:membrane associated protein n=1 Tax=Cryptosporidium ryanae TaxID=515981 RepID=UPI00351A4AA4|nr:membrane associated protein [Cryptosporidium ryanae]
MRYLNTISLSAFLLGLITFRVAEAFFSKSALNCKYQLLPEYINGIGDGEDEIYHSDIRGITHKPENKIFLNIKYESIVTLSIERSYDSDLELSYLNIVSYDQRDSSFIAVGNLTWGGAGNNTRLFLRSKLKPSQYVIVIGSTFQKNEETEKVDNSVCSPVNFEFGLTTPEILYSLDSLSPNDPFSRPVVTININEKYQYSNRVDDSFIIKTTPYGVNSHKDTYNGNIIWSKLFIVSSSSTKEDDLLNLYVELGFRFSKTPLQLIIEQVRTNRAKYESKFNGNSNTHYNNSPRFFFGTPIFNGQLFKESMALKSFRVIVIAPLMSNLPLFALFDLKISISFQSHSKQVINSLLPNQNDCNLRSLPAKIVQSGLHSKEILSLKDPGAIPDNHYYFGDKVSLQGAFESLISKTNHLIHLVISKPSVIHLISHHDHSDIAISLSRSSSLSEEDEDLEFYLDNDDESEHDKTEIEEEMRELEEYGSSNKYRNGSNRRGGGGLRGLKSMITVCSTINLNKKVSSKEMSLIFCKLNEPGDYYIHLHSFKISESQNSVSLCTPFHLKLQITPHDHSSSSDHEYSLCKNPIKLSKFKVPVNGNIDTMNKEKHSVLLGDKYELAKNKNTIHLFHRQELNVSGENNYLSVHLTIPENSKLLVFLNILRRGKIWMSLNPNDLHNYYSSSGPLVPGTYTIQLFSVALERAADLKLNHVCLSFDLNFSLIQLSSLDKDVEDPEIELFSRCIMSHMSLPKMIDLKSNSYSGEYQVDGTYLVPFNGQTGYVDDKLVGEIEKEDGFILKEASYSHLITLVLSRPSAIHASVSNYKGMVLIHTKDNDSRKHKIGSNNLSAFYRELKEGKHELILEFDLMEDFVDETVQEGACPVLKFHLSVTPLELIPVFPPLIDNEVHKYVYGYGIEKDYSKRSHSELLSISSDYLNKLFPAKSLNFDLTRKALTGASKQDLSGKYISYKGSSVDILNISFWYSPFMKVVMPLEIEFEETMLVLRVSLFPSWIPLSLKLLDSNSNNNGNHHFSKQNSARYNGDTVEFSFSGIKKGSYQIVIHSKNQFTKSTMNKSSFMRISGSFKPFLSTRLFSLRQELLSIPDILPFQELPDSLNRIRFFPEKNGQKGLVATIMFTFREVRKTNLVVPKNATLLLRFLSEPTLISGYEFYITILKTKEGNDYVDNKPVFRSGKYGDTFVTLDPGTYDLYFFPNPNNMPYLLTIGITRFNPSEYEDYFRKKVSLASDSLGILNKYNNKSVGSLVKASMEDVFGSKQKCHFYLENFEIKLNEKEDPYFNSGIINVCQGSMLKSENIPSAFTTGFRDIELNIGSSSMVYFHVNSDFIYSFYRIGIIVPEGYWVAEQRGKRSYLEVELTKGKYKLRIESMNSFTSFEEHDMVMFSMYVEVSPIDGSEKFLEKEGIVDNSLDLFNEDKQYGTKNRSSGGGNYESLCNIPNGVPLPLDLTSIQGGSTVFGGPLDTTKPMFLFRSRVTLTDIHNGRKKVFLELNKKYFPIYLRLSVSPVNFDLSESPNLLEVLFTKINSNKIDPVYSNSDEMVNSIEKVFKIDFDTIQDEQKGATHIPYWLTFTHKLDSTSSRISCIAFDVVSHVVSVSNERIYFNEIQTYADGLVSSSSSSFHHIDQVESKLSTALKVKNLPQYVHIPVPDTSLKEASNILDLGSGELEKDIVIDLENVNNLSQALLIVELYYNPLLTAAKMTLYSEFTDDGGENSELDGLTLVKSSKIGFNGDIKSPLYIKETLSVVLTPQKHILECYIRSIPPFDLKKVPVKFGLSLVPLDHLHYKSDPLILYISPDTSVPILAGQNYHISIKLSTPIGNKKSQIIDSFYILNRKESTKGDRVRPYNVQILESGYSIGIFFRYTDIIKVLQDDADQFTKRGFLVIETSGIYQKEGKYKYKLAPWIKSYLSENGRTYLEISCYKTNSLGWANIVWNGNLDYQFFDKNENSVRTEITSKTQGYNLRTNNNVGLVSEKSPVRNDKTAKGVSVSYSRPQTVGLEGDASSNSIESFIQNGKEYADSSNNGVLSSLIDTNYGIGHYYYNNTIKSVENSTVKWTILSLVAILVLVFFYRSQIYKLTIYAKDHINSYFSEYKNKNEYNLIEERNNFDFLNNVESDDEDDKPQVPGCDGLNGSSSPNPCSTQEYDLPYCTPPRNKKKV